VCCFLYNTLRRAFFFVAAGRCGGGGPWAVARSLIQKRERAVLGVRRQRLLLLPPCVAEPPNSYNGFKTHNRVLARSSRSGDVTKAKRLTRR
jgi:hypothetical protein